MFLNNSGNIVFELLIYALLKSMVMLIIKLTSKTKRMNAKNDENSSAMNKYAKKMNNSMGLAFFIEFIRALHLEVVIAAFIGVRNFWVKPFFVWLNSAISLFVVLFYFKFVVDLTIQSKKVNTVRVEAFKNKWNEDKLEKELTAKGLKKWNFLIEEIKPEVSLKSGMLQEYLITKDFFIAFFIVIFMEYPGV
jgi:hypothetical protein